MHKEDHIKTHEESIHRSAIYAESIRRGLTDEQREEWRKPPYLGLVPKMQGGKKNEHM